jgi:hypothetical protein
VAKTKKVYSQSARRWIAVETLSPPGRRMRKRKGKPFKAQWVPVPGWWIDALRRAGAGAHHLALVILAEEFKTKYTGNEIVLSSVVTKMSRNSKARAVKELVGLGLISVEQSGRQATIVSGICSKKPRN